jgi:hypothetical protein
MNTLRLILIISAFAWAQICCCPAQALVDAVRGTTTVAGLQQDCGVERSCGCPEDVPVLPCDDHESCAACQPRLAWVPDTSLTGHAEPGEGMPAHVGFTEPLPLTDVWRPLAAAGRTFLDPPTLVRLHCALVI